MKNKLSIDEEVRFTIKAKKLDGILSHPTTEAPYPAIVLLHGSDRSGVKDPYYTEHAENLVQSGFAVLRYDGPGWGGASSEESAFETLEYRTEEAIAAIQYLQSRPDVKSNAVGLWGISQGGWICQMAAAAYDGVAFIIAVSGPGVTPVEQEVYRVEAESRAADFNEEEITKAVLMRRAMADIVLAEPIYQEVNLSQSQSLGDGPWRKMVELAYNAKAVDLGTELGEVIEVLKTIKDEHWAKPLHLDQVLSMLNNLAPQAWGMAKAQMKAVMGVNPANFLTKVNCPVLAIFGEADTSVPVEKSVALYKKYLGEACNKALTIRVFPKASHTIRVGETFASGYFELTLDWLENLQIK
jgi:dipeptidyl aminopeptidase/acylaminoacyl peptidase